MMKFVISPILVIMTMTFAPEALADSADKARAAALLDQGNTLYDRADYKSALAKFKQAAALYPTPEIELNIGLTHERLRDLPAAATHFERFLNHVDRRADEARFRAIQQKLESIRKKLGTVSVVCKVKGAAVTVDGEPAGSTPLSHRLYVLPGRHELAVIGAGQKPFSKTLELVAGQHEVLKAKLQPLAAVKEPGTGALDLTPRPPPKTGPRPFYKKWWFWTAVGVAVAGATTAVVASQTGGSDELPWGELMIPTR